MFNGFNDSNYISIIIIIILFVFSTWNKLSQNYPLSTIHYPF
jgi:hypothetical protein